jgi:hypothetical protein
VSPQVMLAALPKRHPDLILALGNRVFHSPGLMLTYP